MPAHNPAAMALSLAASAPARGGKPGGGLERQREHDAEELLHVDADGALPPQRLLLYLDCFFVNFRLDGKGVFSRGYLPTSHSFLPKSRTYLEKKKRSNVLNAIDNFVKNSAESQQ